MQVLYKTEIKGTYPDRTLDPKTKFCCHEMSYNYHGDHFKVDDHYGITKEIAMFMVGYEPDHNGEYDSFSVKINNCPFCGDTFEFIETERVRIVSELKNVTKTVTERSETPVVEYRREE